MREKTFLLMVCLLLWIAGEASGSVFYSPEEANRILKVRKRANSMFEELKAGSLERECNEEMCNFEEAREIFITKEATLNFWTVYFDGDQCQPNACGNGTCIDQIGGFDCLCHEGYEGRHCQHEVFAKNCSYQNGGCEQFCEEDSAKGHRICSCLPGYKLKDNFRSCEANNRYTCGKRPNDTEAIIRVTGGKVGKKGDSPWQVMLYGGKAEFLCGGVLIHSSWVLTAAHCLKREGPYRVKLGKYHRKTSEPSEKTIAVDKHISHPNYNQPVADNDIALLHLEKPSDFTPFIIPICLPNKGLSERELMEIGNNMTVSGWGTQSEDSNSRSLYLMYINIPLANHSECSQVMDNQITDNMICAGKIGDTKDACKGDSGGPMVTKYKGTFFLVGLVSWGEGCGKAHKFGVYTKVSNYLEWIRQNILPDRV